jgi:hypothetical protein
VSTAITVGVRGGTDVVAVGAGIVVDVVVVVDVDDDATAVAERVFGFDGGETRGAAIAVWGKVVSVGMVTATVVATRTSITSAGPVEEVVEAGIVVDVVDVEVVVGRTISTTFAEAELSVVTVPFALVAVTSNLMYLSMSSSVSVYVVLVAPEIFE